MASPLPLRLQLGAVLDALTRHTDVSLNRPSHWLALASARVVSVDERLVRITSPRSVGRYPELDAWVSWATTDPAEAFELLQARDLVPTGYAGRWVCEVCGGRGVRRARDPDRAFPGVEIVGRCLTCDGTGTLPRPPTVAALASWASLGFAAHDDGTPGILGAEELASSTTARPQVRWQVGVPRYERPLPQRSPGARLRKTGLSPVYEIHERGPVVTIHVPLLGGPRG